MVTLNINGRDMQVDADESTPVLWALRDNLNLTGTKFGCGAALCGTCTVHQDHDHRGNGRRQGRQGGAGCVGASRCAAVRLLPERPQCRTENGFVIGPTGQKANYGSLADAAMTVFRLTGKRLRKLPFDLKTA